MIFRWKITWERPISQSCYRNRYPTWYPSLLIHPGVLPLSFYLVFGCRCVFWWCWWVLGYFLHIATRCHHSRLLWIRLEDSFRMYGCRVYMLSFASGSLGLFWLCSQNRRRSGLNWGRRWLYPCRWYHLPSWFYSIPLNFRVYGLLRDLWPCLPCIENFLNLQH